MLLIQHLKTCPIGLHRGQIDVPGTWLVRWVNHGRHKNDRFQIPFAPLRVEVQAVGDVGELEPFTRCQIGQAEICLTSGMTALDYQTAIGRE